MIDIGSSFADLVKNSGIMMFMANPKALIMVGIACVLLYLAIVKHFEPLLLLPIAFGMLLTNLLGSEVYHEELFAGGHANWSLIGGEVLVDAAKLTGEHVTEYMVNAGGAVLYAGNIVAQITGATGVTGSELVALSEVIEYMASNGTACTMVLKDAFLSGGQVYTATGQLFATAGTSITPGLLDYLYLGVKLGIYPCLIFLGVGATTDFGPLPTPRPCSWAPRRSWASSVR